MFGSRLASLAGAIFFAMGASACGGFADGPLPGSTDGAAPPNAVPPPATGVAGTPHTITFDAYSLSIDDERLYLWAGEFHYWRLPSPDLWRDVLEKMKAAGYNAANIYFHWGYHSPAPGVYDFTGVRDVDQLLDIAADVGIYVIARPGPYINAETDGGGLPAWLDRLPGEKRSEDPTYLAYSDEWLSQISPILARHQLTNGTGTILFTQVENEFYDGSPSARAYMQHLGDKLRSEGISVPLIGNHNGVYNSGVGAVDLDGWDNYPLLFNCSNPTVWNPVPDFSGVRSTLTDRPLFFVEYQGGAFDYWGGPGYERCRTLTGPSFEKVFYATNIAAGATLQSFYMTYGGISWGYLPFPGVYTSYDYGAAITADRLLTSKYDQQKFTGYFLSAVPSINKTVALPAPAPSNPALWLRGRINPDDGTRLYVLRHADGTSTDRNLTHLALDLDADVAGVSGYSYDDIDPALEYSGGWTPAAGQSWTVGDYHDTETFSATAGDRLTVAFHGGRVRWLSSLESNHGIASVAIDGREVATVDTYGAMKQHEFVAFEASDLSDADHTLTISVTGQQNPASFGSFVVIDAIDLPPAATGGPYASVPQEPGTSIAIAGRDAKLLLANYRFGGQHLVYSTAQLLTQATLEGTDLAILRSAEGEDSETVLRYGAEPSVAVLSGSATSVWDAAQGDLRINTRHAGLTKLVITGGGRPELVLLLADDATAAEFWRFDTDAGALLARGPYLIRSAALSGGTLELRGDTDSDTPLEVYAPASVREVRWNGTPVPVDGTTDPRTGPLRIALRGPVPIEIPALTWRYRFDTPEREALFDDFGWKLASHDTSLNTAANGSAPVLGADEYGFHYGHVWYRGHFTALGGEQGVFLSGSTGNGAGQFAAWLNGVYLGTGNGGVTLPLPAEALRVGQDNVISVLIANMGHDEGSSKAQRGLVNARLEGSIATISWRVQGTSGGEDPLDPVRDPMNTGGLHGERAGWYLPGFPDEQWQPASLPFADAQPGVAWYRSQFDLDLPRDSDVPIVLRFEENSTRRYRAQIYLNGWNLGLYINDIGPQHDFTLPPGLLRSQGANTLALAVWSNDAAGGLGPVSLVALGNYSGGVRAGDVGAPEFDAPSYAERLPPAHLTLAGPDAMERGGVSTLTATLSVPSDRAAISDADITLSAPPGWLATGDLRQHIGVLLPGQSSTVTWSIQATTSEQPLSAMLTANAHVTPNGRRQQVATLEAGKPIALPPVPPRGDRFVSDIAFQSDNGWGPVERDLSNGEQGSGDGRRISLRGTAYAKGLGAHSPGNISVFLGGRCTSFTAVVGVDDETNGNGSVRFVVFADNVEVASTDVMTGATAPVTLAVDLGAAQWLNLRTDDGGDGNGSDHADWAEAMIHCAP